MTDRYFNSVDFAGSDSGGGGFTLGPQQNIFVGANRAAAEAARDAYAAANPAWLAAYNADTNLNIRLSFTEGTASVAVFQIRNNIGYGWLDNDSFEAVQGPPGQDGQDGQADLTSVTNGRVPFDNNGTLADSPIRVMEDGTAFIQGITRVEGGTIAVGPFVQISERGGFVGITNALGDEFTLVDFRTARDSASSRPRLLELTEAENNFDIQTVQTETLTSPINFNYTPTLLARSNAFIGQVGSDITNLRLRISDIQTGSVFKYFPSEAAWLDGTGVDFAVGEMTLDFGDTELPLSAGRQLGIEIRFDSGSLLGDTNGIPALTSMLQRGQFTDLAYLRDVPSEVGEDNVQSNWNETDANSDAFILNKPSIPTNTNDFVDTLTAEVSGQDLTITLGRTGTLDDLSQTVTLPGGGTTPGNGPDALYYGLSSSNNPAVVDLSTLTGPVDATDPQTVTTGVAAQGDYFIILSANTHDITAITDTVLNQPVLDIFTKTNDVRTEGGVTYDSYVIGPLNADLNESYVLEF